MALGLTQKELGERLHTDQTTVSAWEMDKPQKLAGPSLVALAELLFTTPGALTTGQGFKLPEVPTKAPHLAVEIEGSLIVPLAESPKPGQVMIVSAEATERPRVLGQEDAFKEIQAALATDRRVWVIIR